MPILGNDVFRVDMRPILCRSMLGICRFVPLYVILEYDAEHLSLGAQYVVNHGRHLYRFGFSDTGYPFSRAAREKGLAYSTSCLQYIECPRALPRCLQELFHVELLPM